MYLADIFLADYIGAFVQWGFLMAMLYSFVSSINAPSKSMVYLSAIMFLSYISSDFLSIANNMYLNWIVFDFTTIVIIVIALKTSIIKASVATHYIICGLLVNACLTYALYVDLYINWNTEEWWLWSLYSMGVNIIDLLMVTIIFINRDFIGLMKLKRRLIKLYSFKGKYSD